MAIRTAQGDGHRSIVFVLTSMRRGEGKEGKGGRESGREVAFRGLSARPETRRGHSSPSRLNIDEVDTDVEEKE